MGNPNVRFFFGSLAKYQALAVKEPMALYFLTDEKTGKVYLYKGEQLFASDALASTIANGWMSKEDKIALDTLVEASANSVVLQPVDSTISIVDNKIGVQVSKSTGNLIAVKDDGLFVAVDPVLIEDVVGLKDKLEAIEKSMVGGIRYKGSVPTVADLPSEAVQGDLYEVTEDNSEWCFNGEKWFEYGKTNSFTPVAGDGISIVDGTIAIKLADNTHGLTAVDGALSLVLASKTNDGAMSKEDKAFIASIPSVYVAKKYEIASVPEGTLVNYGEKEIRIMCPTDAVWTKQAVGVGGDVNTYYMTFKTYAPSEDAVGYIEHLGNQSDAEILTDLRADEHGRRYQPTWLGVAKYDEASDSWTYYGANSAEGKYIGWDYQVDWFNADGVMIASDNVRINLTNENCHNTVVPYYMNNYATTEQIAEVEQTMAWGEL